ncbi:MAG: DUF3857 domain-containing protein [Deltaproteobacteria bacterium]|nr:DUF3857 domain-containing protein [Deltaproteobacteria bacterium]
MTPDKAGERGRGSRTGRPLCLLLSIALATILVTLSAPSQAANPWRVATAPAWAERLEVDTTVSSEADNSASRGAEVLLQQRDVRFEGSTALWYTHRAFRIVNESGLQAASMLTWEVDPSYEQLVFHSVAVRRGADRFSRLRTENVRVTAGDGTLEHKMFEGTQTVAVVLDDLRLGDVVEYEYTLRSNDPTLGGRVALSETLGSSQPTRRLHVRVALPPHRQVQWKVHLPQGAPDTLEPRVETTPEGTVLLWDRTALAGETPEDDIPSWYASLPYVQVGEFASWREVVDWATAMYGQAAEPTPEIKSLVSSWRKEGNDDTQIISRATRFVQEQIRYVGLEIGMGRRRPARAGDVLRRRYGDCKDKSVLLVSLLRAGGISADPALVSTSIGPILTDMMPSPGLFDHVIVRVAPGKFAPYWIDPTATHEGGDLDRYHASSYANALVLRAGVAALESMPEPAPESNSITLTETFRVQLPSTSDAAELDAERVYEADQADGFRQRFQRQSADQIDKYYLGLYTSIFPRIEKLSPLERADDRGSNRLRVVAHFKIPGFWSWDAAENRHSVQLDSSLTSEVLKQPGAASRKAPLQFDHPLLAVHRMTVEFPTDWEVAPVEENEASTAFSFRHTTTYANKRMEMLWEVRSKKAFVSSTDLLEHASSIERARKHTSTVLTYKAPAPDGIQWPTVVGLMLLAPALAYGVVRAWRWSPAPATQPPQPGLEKASIGTVLVGFRCLSGPFVMLSNLVDFRWMLSTAQWAGAIERMAASRWAYTALVAAETTVQVTLWAYSVVVALLFFLRKRSFPTHFTVFNLAWPAWAVADYFLCSLVPVDYEIDELFNAKTMSSFIATFLFVMYVRTSKRIAARFQA